MKLLSDEQLLQRATSNKELAVLCQVRSEPDLGRNADNLRSNESAATTPHAQYLQPRGTKCLHLTSKGSLGKDPGAYPHAHAFAHGKYGDVV